MKFISLDPSTRKDKKYKIVFSEPNKTIHFGSKNSSTYIDNKNKTTRKNYLARHKVNEDWNNINAGSLSALILWGNSTDITTNLKSFLNKFKIEYTNLTP